MPKEPIPIIVDTQEQQPWQLNPEEFSCQRMKLRTGDYSIRGLESVVTIERKSLGDFVNTVTHDWIRFRKQLYRMGGFDCAVIVVEATVADVFDIVYETEANPKSVMGRAADCMIDHGIPVCWWGDRTNCVYLVEQFLRIAHRRYWRD